MSQSILEAFKKRKKTLKFFALHSFAGIPIFPTGPFVDNIQFFLQECAELEDYEVERISIWITFLVHESRGFAAPMYTIEETEIDFGELRWWEALPEVGFLVILREAENLEVEDSREW
nr:PHD finger protein MALE MEIOCYTE DEATH 1 [Ipomoea batatas]